MQATNILNSEVNSVLIKRSIQVTFCAEFSISGGTILKLILSFLWFSRKLKFLWKSSDSGHILFHALNLFLIIRKLILSFLWFSRTQRIVFPNWILIWFKELKFFWFNNENWNFSEKALIQYWYSMNAKYGKELYIPTASTGHAKKILRKFLERFRF